MPISQDQKKRFRKIAHHLKPVVLLGEQGLSEGVIGEIERALEDHELIKVRVNTPDRDEKVAIIDTILKQTRAESVQTIGKIVVLYRAAQKPNPRLSNVLRFQEH